jgi:eukaryotic-like serine/threonine-protein kinase
MQYMIAKDVRIYSPYKVALLAEDRCRLIGKRNFIVNKTIANFIEGLSKPLYYDEYLANLLATHHLPKDELVPLVDGFLYKMMGNGIVEYEENINPIAKLEPNTLFDKKFIIKKRIANKKKYSLYWAKDVHNNTEVAIKLFYLSKQEALLHKKDNQLKRLKLEFEKSTSFGEHPNLCKYVEFEESEYVYFVMEYLSSISLKKICVSKKYSFKKRIAFASDIISAVAFIHKQGGLHGDLHASNFVLDAKTNKLKLIDFDFAKSPNEALGTLVNGGLYDYLPPERVRIHKNKVFSDYEGSPTAEVYQLGNILYYLFFNELPFKADTWEELATKIKYEKVNPVFKGRATLTKQKIKKIILDCLEKDPLNRPFSAVELLERWVAI